MYIVSNYKVIQLVLTAISLIAIEHIKCELFTALAHMKQLIQVEDVILSNLRNYVANQKKHIHFLRSQLIEYEDNHAKASVDVSEYLANPLNAFLVTKRLTSDFLDIRYVMESGLDDEIARNLSRYRTILQFPTEEDLKGTAEALLRVQKTYNINASSIANGDFGDSSPYRHQMSSDDCYFLANYSAEKFDYSFAIVWFREALARLSHKDFEWKLDIHRRLINLTLETDDLVEALYFTNQLLLLTPDDKHIMEYKLYIEDQLKDIPMPKLNEDTRIKESESTFIEPISYDYYDDIQEEQYKKLCRQEIVPTAKQLAPLRCRYVHDKSPFLKIAPLKMEEANIDPYIVVYHQVIHDTEIEILKAISKERMQTAQVYDYETGEYIPSAVRTSKSVFLSDKTHKYIRDISVRVEDMTALKLTTAEDLQIVNYGIGGHYDPHIDFFPDDVNGRDGNRIATVLFYMSDVHKGGATVFPFTNTVLWPEKGSAAFWYNLYKSGVGDLRTKHAACPVLAGTKWVSNKWLHSGDQEFMRPCSLQRDDPPNKQQEDMISVSEDEDDHK